MAEFFRFRSMDSLLGKHRELETQTIYFASPEELNDPMEGLRDIVWDGDKIVWTNFFKHYVFCLNRSYSLLQSSRPQKLDVNSIPILERWDQMTNPMEKKLFDDIWDRFCNLPFIPEIMKAIANTRRKVRYSEIIYYFQGIHFVLLDEIRKSYIDHGIMSKSQVFQQPGAFRIRKVGTENRLNTIRAFESIEDEDKIETIFQLEKNKIDDINLTLQYRIRTHPSGNIRKY